MDVAEHAAEAYRANPKVLAVAAAGSVGAGTADEWSDLELDVYWREPPTDDDRLAPISAIGGEVDEFWPWSAHEEEWGEEFHLGRLGVGISSYLGSTVDRMITDVTVNCDTSTNSQMRLASIQSARPLFGNATIEAWRHRTTDYPDELRRQMVLRYLSVERLDGWHLREAFVHRRDLLALHDLLGRGHRSVLGALHGLNRAYLANPRMKWERTLLESFEIAPTHLSERLGAIWSEDFGNRVRTLESLLRDTIDLAERHVAVSLTDIHSFLLRGRAFLLDPSS